MVARGNLPESPYRAGMLTNDLDLENMRRLIAPFAMFALSRSTGFASAAFAVEVCLLQGGCTPDKRNYLA